MEPRIIAFVNRVVARAASLAFVLGAAGRLIADVPVIVPCDGLPAAVAALGLTSELDAFGVAPAASVAVAATLSAGEEDRSLLWFARGGDEPRAVKLAGRVMGLAVTGDGTMAYAVVRTTDRKGVVRTVWLTRVDLKTARATPGLTLPTTARGLAIGPGGATLMVASRDEIRTFQLPGLASGKMYRVPGENVGVAPLGDSSGVLVAQSSRIVLADLAGAQGRDGLVLSQEAAAPARLTGMLSSTGDAGTIAIADGGSAWCVRAAALAPPPPPVPEAAAEPAAATQPPLEVPPADLPAEVATAPPAPVPQAPAPVPPIVPAAPEIPAAPGTVSGTISGPAVAEVAAIVFLGPDNVLRESLRVSPDERGRFRVSALPSGAYRLVAAGKAGRVLICDPPFITIRVGGNGAVEAPVLKILRAQ